MAVKHPNWVMGPQDFRWIPATLMDKGLERLPGALVCFNARRTLPAKRWCIRKGIDSL